MIQKIFTSGGLATSNLTATSNSILIGGTPAHRTFLILDLTDGGSYVFGTSTIKINARAIGAGADGASGFTSFVAITNKISTGSGPAIAGGTGIVALGVYEIDITGLEAQVEYTRGTATGTLTIRAVLVDQI